MYIKSTEKPAPYTMVLKYNSHSCHFVFINSRRWPRGKVLCKDVLLRPFTASLAFNNKSELGMKTPEIHKILFAKSCLESSEKSDYCWCSVVSATPWTPLLAKGENLLTRVLLEAFRAASWQGIEKQKCDYLSENLLAQPSLEVRARYMTLGWICAHPSAFLIIMVWKECAKYFSLVLSLVCISLVLYCYIYRFHKDVR